MKVNPVIANVLSRFINYMTCKKKMYLIDLREELFDIVLNVLVAAMNHNLSNELSRSTA